jgi:peroxiredoxin
MRLLILLWLLLTNPDAGQIAFPIELKDLRNKSVTYRPGPKTKVIALVFLLPDCPACQSYSKTLNDLQRDYRALGLELIGVFPGKYATVAEADAFRTSYKIDFPLFIDPEQQLVRMTGATVAPEAFVFTKSGQQEYEGRIDDWMIEPGKKRLRVRNNDLRLAVNALLNGRPVPVSKTTPIGCIIEE